MQPSRGQRIYYSTTEYICKAKIWFFAIQAVANTTRRWGFSLNHNRLCEIYRFINIASVIKRRIIRIKPERNGFRQGYKKQMRTPYLFVAFECSLLCSQPLCLIRSRHSNTNRRHPFFVKATYVFADFWQPLICALWMIRSRLFDLCVLTKTAVWFKILIDLFFYGFAVTYT